MSRARGAATAAQASRPAGELDVRLRDPLLVSAFLAFAIREQHTRRPRAAECPACGWVATQRERQCRSYVVASALLLHTGVPSWHGDDAESTHWSSAAPADQPALFGELDAADGIGGAS
jgi:hypothetical protein